LNSSILVRALAGTQPAAVMVVKNQTVPDIMSRMLAKHAKCIPDYDKIYKYFLGGDLTDVCKRLWTFCKKNFNYEVEGEKAQYVSSPITMLINKDVDCKNYALFIGGVLDAIKRSGAMKLDWQYRFASYQFLSDPGHVFVVVNPKKENIWVDPVLDEFNNHFFYFHAVNKQPKVGSIGYMPLWSGSAIGNAAGDKLNTMIMQYADGVANAAQFSIKTNTINTITSLVLQSAAFAVPGLGEALMLLKGASILVNDAFGVGSAAGRVLSDITSFNPVGLVNDLFNGRTYQYQVYWMAAMYNYYVLGNNKNNQDLMKDGDVWPALKWFIDRTGVYISGTELLQALTISADKYLSYYNVNKSITTDRARVEAAVQVAQQWRQGMPINPGEASSNWLPQYRGAWTNTIGVFDQQLVNIANMTGKSVEQVAAQQGDQYAYDYLNYGPGSSSLSSSQLIPGVDNWLLAAAAGAAILGYAILE
jgi:hypothetical protein